ncbi:MAG: hypothetical protein Q8L27_03695 [archaeon]|nr:hypothetical protein [archaeon]
METELGKIYKLRRKSINELGSTRETLCEIMDRFLTSDDNSKSWKTFYYALNRCQLINNALAIKPDTEKEVYLEYAEQLMEWSIKKENYNYAAKMRDRIGFFKHSYIPQPKKKVTRQTL